MTAMTHSRHAERTKTPALRKGQSPTGQWFDIAFGAALLEGENAVPVVLHPDDCPALLVRLVVESLAESPDLGVGQPLRRSVGIFALVVVVQHKHHQPHAVACTDVFQHLLVAGRVAERCTRTAANLQVNTFGLSRIVVVQE